MINLSLQSVLFNIAEHYQLISHIIVTSPPWRLKSTATPLFIQSLVQAYIKETTKLRITGHSEGNLPWNSPHKGPVTRKTFPFHAVIIIYWLKTMSFHDGKFVPKGSIGDSRYDKLLILSVTTKLVSWKILSFSFMHKNGINNGACHWFNT